MRISGWLLLIILLAISEKILAAMDGFGVSARSIGMADAFTAVADDDSAILQNPAGLTQLQETILSAQYADLLNGLTNASNVGVNSLGFAHPLDEGRRGTVGFFYQNFKAANYFIDQTMYVSYAKKLSSQGSANWSVGGNIKQFTRRYESNQTTENAVGDNGVGTGVSDPLFAKNGFSKTVYSADIGLLVQFGEMKKNNFGVSISNLNRPDISLGKDGDRAPLVDRIGLARKYEWGLLSTELRMIKRLPNQTDSEIAFGGERKIPLSHIGAFGLRAGCAEGTRGFRNIYAGFSFGMSLFRLDYAFEFPLGALASVGPNHFAALSFGFGKATNTPVSAVELPADKVAAGTRKIYELSRNTYLTRKAEGASVQECLRRLQDMYLQVGLQNIDVSWMAEELASLGSKKPEAPLSQPVLEH